MVIFVSFFFFYFSENPAVRRAIINYIPICNEGRFRWYVHDGALGLKFKLSVLKEFQLCFVLQVENVRVQVSEERTKTSLSSNEGPSTLRPVLSADSRTKETCILSSDMTVKLFLEPERTVNSIGFGFVELHFIMEKRNSDRSMEGRYTSLIPSLHKNVFKMFFKCY